jgi:hypothetical protein
LDGRTTSAIRAVSVRKISWTTRKLEVAETLFGMVQVRIGYQRVFTDDVQGLELSARGLWESFP